jgi:hypothetical protein
MAASVKEKPGTPTMIEMFASFASLVQSRTDWPP